MIRYIWAKISAAAAKRIAQSCALCAFALAALCFGITPAEAAPATPKASSGAAFSDDPLSLKRHPASKKAVDGAIEQTADGRKKAKVVYGATGPRREQPLTLGDEGRVSLSVTRKKAPESRLEPAHTPFSGGENTLPYMGADPPPEVSMQYQLRDNAAARLTVNPQEPVSPLYRRVESDGRINSAGVYMDVDLTPEVRLQVGGEHRNVGTRDAQAGTAQGAAVGVQWNF